MHNFHIIVGSAKRAVKQWRAQYGAQIGIVRVPRAEILRKLEALENPTKRAVNKVVGYNGWTDIWCDCCGEYKPKVASFGAGVTVEVCEPCLRLALAKLEKRKIEK